MVFKKYAKFFSHDIKNSLSLISVTLKSNHGGSFTPSFCRGSNLLSLNFCKNLTTLSSSKFSENGKIDSKCYARSIHIQPIQYNSSERYKALLGGQFFSNNRNNVINKTVEREDNSIINEEMENDRLNSRRKVRKTERNTTPRDFVQLKRFVWNRTINENLQRSALGMLHTFDFSEKNFDSVKILTKDLLKLDRSPKEKLKGKTDSFETSSSDKNEMQFGYVQT